MIRVMVVADSGASMSTITGTLQAILSVDIVAYASGAAPVGALVQASVPDVVLVDQMSRPGLALSRIREVSGAAAGVAVLGLSGDDPEWVVAGLRAGAGAVVPRSLPPATLARVLQDLVGGGPAVHGPVTRTAA